MKLEVKRVIFGTAFCVFAVSALLLPADAIYLKNGRTVEGKIIREDDKSVTLEIGYGTITIKRAYIKEVIAEEWTPPKVAPKRQDDIVTPAPTENVKPTAAKPASNIMKLLDSYAKSPEQKDINKTLEQLVILPQDGEPWAIFDGLITKSADETEYLLLLIKEIKEPGILKWVILALGKLQVPAAVKPLFEILDGSDEMLKLAVLDALRYMSAKSSGSESKEISTVHLLRGQLAKEKFPRVKTSIINSLYTAEDKDSLLILVDYLDDTDSEVRNAAANGVVALAQKSTADELRSVDLMGRLKDKLLLAKQKETRDEVIDIFKRLKSPEAVDALMGLLTDENAEIRSESAMALGGIGDKKAVSFLIERLQKDEDEWTRMQIIGALQNCGDTSATPAIIESLRDDKERVRLCAARALRNMTKNNFSDDYGKWKEWWELEQKK